MSHGTELIMAEPGFEPGTHTPSTVKVPELLSSLAHTAHLVSGLGEAAHPATFSCVPPTSEFQLLWEQDFLFCSVSTSESKSGNRHPTPGVASDLGLLGAKVAGMGTAMLSAQTTWYRCLWPHSLI